MNVLVCVVWDTQFGYQPIWYLTRLESIAEGSFWIDLLSSEKKSSQMIRVSPYYKQANILGCIKEECQSPNVKNAIKRAQSFPEDTCYCILPRIQKSESTEQFQDRLKKDIKVRFLYDRKSN